MSNTEGMKTKSTDKSVTAVLSSNYENAMQST